VIARTERAASRLITAALVHPLTMRIKAPLRNAFWSIRGIGTRNPPLPRRVNSVLFVCLGNICRSPFGAGLARRLLAEAGRGDISCASAGIRTSQAAGSPHEACLASSAFGVSLIGHQPQALTPELIESHDVVLVMEQRQLAHVGAAFPKYRDRIFLLSLFDDSPRNAYERYNIADPFGDTPDAYRACFRRIERALRCWMRAGLDHAGRARPSI
jgi:protein-tyrosine phosphatase